MTNVTSVASWLVESFRFTGFVPAGIALDAKDWFAQAAQTPAESSVSQPPLGQYVEQGLVEIGNLRLAISPGRFDWTYSPPNSPADEIRNIGPVNVGLAVFRTLIERWLPKCPPLARLAVGIVLVRPVTTLAEGYRDLARYLPFLKALDVEGAEDFFYTINRPRRSELGSIVVNRISRWSVVRFQSVQIQINVAGSQPSQVVPIDIGCGSRLDLDINTKPVAASELTVSSDKLFAELVSTALEISEKGDIR